MRGLCDVIAWVEAEDSLCQAVEKAANIKNDHDAFVRLSTVKKLLVTAPTSASAQPAEDVDKPTLATLLEAAGARRVVICHDGSGKPFDAYDKPIADRVVGQLSLRLTKLRMALQEISEIRYGYEPDSSATGIANDALFTDDEEAK